MEQQAPETTATETTTEATATPSTESAQPVATATTDSAPAITDEGSGVPVAGPEDAYLKAVKEKLAKKSAPEPEAKPETEGEAHKSAEGEPAADAKSAKGETRDAHRGKWWKSKSPEEKASITAKQTREELKAARDEIKALKAQIEALQPKPGKKGELTRADFETDRDWQRHLVDERLLELSEAKAAEEKEQAEETAKTNARNAKWAEAMKSAFPDPEEREAAANLFHEKINKMTISPSVCEYILESGQPRLLLHIVRHPGALELLKPGTPELLVGKRLTAIEQYLEKQASAKLADTEAKPAATSARAASHEPLLKAATGSANNIGSAGVKANNAREAQARDLQARILGLRV